MNLGKHVYSLKIKVAAALLVISIAWTMLGSYKAFAGTLWTQKDDGLDNGEWKNLSSSADGTILAGIFLNFTDNLYHVEYSDDSGDSWTDVTPDDTEVADEDENDPVGPDHHVWSGIDLSEDGSFILLTDSNGVSGHAYVWYSPNAGDAWLNTESTLGNGYWANATLGHDSDYMAVVNRDTEQIMRSIDGGDTWDDKTPATGKNWESLSFSLDGNTLAAAESTDDFVYISYNQGTSWWSTDAPALGWSHVAVANNGFLVASAGASDNLYVYKDGGDGFAWFDTDFGGFTDMIVDISSDGSKLAAAESSGYIFTADMDNETEWNSTSSNQSWKALSMSGDGTHIAAAGYISEIWVSEEDTTAPTVVSTSPENNAEGVAIDAPVTITFSEPIIGIDMDITPCGTVCPAFDQEWSDDYSQVTLRQSNGTLAKNTVYSLTIYAADESENQLAAPYEFSFTTAADESHRRSSTPESRSRGSGSKKQSYQKVPAPVPEEKFALPIKNISADLEFGMTSPNVTVLQQFLIDQNAGPAALALKNHGTTDFFGMLTRAALAEWQKAHGIMPAAGYFGPRTRAVIAAL